MPQARRDPFAGYPETKEFMLLLPSAVLGDDDRREALVDSLQAAFPGITFCAAPCERLNDPDGKPMVIDEPLAVPMMGSVGDDDQPSTLYRRPSPARMAEINSALLTFIEGPAALN